MNDFDWNEYRKTRTIRAIQVTEANIEELADRIDIVGDPAACVEALVDDALLSFWETAYYISTLEGEMRFGVGDWIAEGVADERWPIKEKIFEQSYEVVT